MSSFKDANSRQWVLEITIGGVRRVKQIAGLDLLDLEQGRVLNQLANDVVLLVDVLWILCEDQGQQHGINDEQFGRAFRGDVIEDATEALFEALVDFFPPQRQILLKKVMETAKAMGQKERALIETYLSTDAIEQMMETELEKLKQKLESLTAGNSSTSSPGSAESTPDPSASAN